MVDPAPAVRTGDPIISKQSVCGVVQGKQSVGGFVQGILNPLHKAVQKS